MGRITDGSEPHGNALDAAALAGNRTHGAPMRIAPPASGPPTQAELDAAQRLGVDVGLYRQFKRNAGAAADALEVGTGPRDIVAEEQLYQKMRMEPGLFKGPDTAPHVVVAAARTPGEVAKSLLTIACYLVLMFMLIGFGGETVQDVPGVFQVVAALLLVVPAMMLSSFIWEGIGEGMRDVVRALVRFWPLTLPALIFALGALKLLLG